jgi:hypothetical protein
LCYINFEKPYLFVHFPIVLKLQIYSFISSFEKFMWEKEQYS